MSFLPFWGGEETPDKQYTAVQAPHDIRVPASHLDGSLIEITPYKENDGIQAGASLLQSLHDIRTSNGKNISDAHSFEIWFDRGEFSFYMYASNDAARDRFLRRIGNDYRHSETQVRSDQPAFPVIDEGYYLSGCTVSETEHTFHPLRHREGEEYKFGDPYKDVMSEMLTLDDSIVVMQVVFKAARDDWTQNGPDGRSVDDLAEELKRKKITGMKDPKTWLGLADLKEKEPGKIEKKEADRVRDQREEEGFHTNIRVLAASPDPGEVEARARGVGSMFKKHFSTDYGQKLNHEPVDGSWNGTIEDFCNTIVGRRWEDWKMILTMDELAGIAHIPNEEIEVPQIPWKTTKAGSSIAGSQQKDKRRTGRRSN